MVYGVGCSLLGVGLPGWDKTPSSEQSEARNDSADSRFVKKYPALEFGV